MMKINVDGAFISSSGTAAVGVVIRYHNGQVKLASWRLLRYCRDAKEAKAVAYCEGIALAAQWPDILMVLETDSAMVAAKLKQCDGPIGGLVPCSRSTDKYGGAVEFGDG